MKHIVWTPCTTTCLVVQRWGQPMLRKLRTDDTRGSEVVYTQCLIHKDPKISVSSWYSGLGNEALATQKCATLCDPMCCSLPVSSIHELLQARILVDGHSLLQGIFPIQGLNLGLLHYHLFTVWAHQRSRVISAKQYYFTNIVSQDNF